MAGNKVRFRGEDVSSISITLSQGQVRDFDFSSGELELDADDPAVDVIERDMVESQAHPITSQPVSEERKSPAVHDFASKKRSE